MFPLLTIPLPCFHTFMIKYIQSQAAILIHPMPFKKLMFSLCLVCLGISILHITAKIILQRTFLNQVYLYKLWNVTHSLSSKKQSTWTLRSSSIYHAGLIFHYSLHIDIHLSSNTISIHRYFFYIETIFLNILCLFSVSIPVLKVFSPNDILLPSTLILPTTQNLPQMLTLKHQLFSEVPFRYDLFIL